jgi:hypothetical protein
VLPQAHGTFLAVAGQEPCIADTPAAAWAWIDATHPEDNGALGQYTSTDVLRQDRVSLVIAGALQWRDDAVMRGLDHRIGPLRHSG